MRTPLVRLGQLGVVVSAFIVAQVLSSDNSVSVTAKEAAQTSANTVPAKVAVNDPSPLNLYFPGHCSDKWGVSNFEMECQQL